MAGRSSRGRGKAGAVGRKRFASSTQRLHWIVPGECRANATDIYGRGRRRQCGARSGRNQFEQVELSDYSFVSSSRYVIRITLVRRLAAIDLRPEKSVKVHGFTRMTDSGMITVMRSIGIRLVRRIALLVLMPLLVSVIVGCSSFNREWRKAGRTPPPATVLDGRWEGQWLSEVNGHHGKLRCIIRQDGEVYRARFRAKYRKILSFGYTVQLQAERIDDGYKFHGEADLGTLAGGVYHYEGHADATTFLSTYSCQYDHGTFRMHRAGNGE